MLPLNYPMWVDTVPILYIGNSTSTSATITAVTGIANGDVMVMVAAGRSTISNPSGWTLRREFSTDPYIKVWSRVAASEGASYTVGGDVKLIVAHRNVTAVDVVGNIYQEIQPTSGGGNTSILAPTITPANSGLLLGVYVRMSSSATVSSSTVPDMSRKANVADNISPGRNQSIAVFTKTQNSTATGDKTATASGGTDGSDYGMLMQIY